jgi:peptidoglycan/LPS O-acetylase OafA/YrhL
MLEHAPWSLSAEWFAYLTFPFFQIAARLPRSTLTPILLSLCCLALFATVIMVKGVSDPGVTGTPGMLRMACEFAAGCFLFTAVRNGLSGLGAWADWAVFGLLGVAIGVGGAMIWLALPAFGLVVLLAAGERGLIAAVLALPVVVWLGEISYSLYITHWIVLQVGKWELSVINPPGLFGSKSAQSALLAVLCFAVAFCAHRWIELPSRNHGRNWARRLVAGVPASLPAVAGNSIGQPPAPKQEWR